MGINIAHVCYIIPILSKVIQLQLSKWRHLRGGLVWVTTKTAYNTLLLAAGNFVVFSYQHLHWSKDTL